MKEELQNYLQKIEKIIAKDPQYKFEAYTFVLSALHETIGKLEEPRHISGAELAKGIKDFAIEQFGPMAKTVIHYWGVYETLDFGVIVFNLIDEGLLKKQPEDKLDDFKNVYSFDEAFSDTLVIEG